jgi:hypothetical protein
MPNRAVVANAVVAVSMWTLFCLVAWGAVAFGGAVIEAAIEIVLFWLPGFADFLQAIVRFLSGLGGGVVGLVWALGAATIAFGTWILRHGDGTGFVYRETAYYGRGRAHHAGWQTTSRPMKDVTPPLADEDDDIGPPPPPDRRRLPPR